MEPIDYTEDMKPIQKLAIAFLNKNWDLIDKEKTEITVTKSALIKQIKTESWVAGWIVTEVMSWGCDTNFLKSYEVECDDHFVIKIGKSYFQLVKGSYHYFKKVKPKFKKVAYFD